MTVDLSVAGADQTTLVFTATGVLTGAGTADQQVPDDKTAAVLAAFTGSLPGQKLPFGVAPDHRGCPWLRHHHRGHRRGSNDPPRRVQTSHEPLH